MLTLRQLLSKTPRDVRLRAQQCGYSLVSEQDVKPEQARGKQSYLEQVYSAHCLDGDKQCTFRFQAGVASKDSLVWVSCSCAYFMYFVEVALKHRGSTSIIYSNGKLPYIRNPTLSAYVCKHLFSIGSRLPSSGGKRRTSAAVDDTVDDAVHLTLSLLAKQPVDREQLEQELADTLTLSQMRELFAYLQVSGFARFVGLNVEITRAGLEHLVVMG